MVKVYLGLGTNLGNKKENLHTAIQKIEERAGKIISQSAFYETAPWGFVSNNSFLNAAICIETMLSPQDLLLCTQHIEQEMGRSLKTVNHSYADRLIDIDLLMYGNWVIQEENLSLPHPLMQDRKFVLQPLADIAPNLIHPVMNKTMEELFKLLK